MARRKPQKNPASKGVTPVCVFKRKEKKSYAVAEMFV